jgi:hypothetical protein
MIVSVIGCGESAADWHKVTCDYSIGCNDAWKFGHSTDALISANWPSKFPKHRLDIIKTSTPEVFYSHVDQWRAFFPNMVKIQLNSWDGHLYPERKNEFSSSNTSPFIAMSMGYKMGAHDIILWGVDLVNHKVYTPENPQTKVELRRFNDYVKALDLEGVKVWLGAEGSVLKLPVWKE